MKNFTEDDLIAYHLNELPKLRALALKRELERDSELAAESEAIAATLRAFREAPTPRVDDAMLDRMWNDVRPSLAVLSPQPRPRFALWTAVAASSLAAVTAMALLLPSHRPEQPGAPGVTMARSTISAQANDVLYKMHWKDRPKPINNHPGPLTDAPVDAVSADPQLAAYLDSAERLLTEVSHDPATPSVETRSQVRRMLLQNAVYQRSAKEHGDLAAADVMDDLGRVLVSLDAEPPQGAQSADAFRVQMNVGSVLFDLRILHSNTNAKASE